MDIEMEFGLLVTYDGIKPFITYSFLFFLHTMTVFLHEK